MNFDPRVVAMLVINVITSWSFAMAGHSAVIGIMISHGHDSVSCISVACHELDVWPLLGGYINHQLVSPLLAGYKAFISCESNIHHG